MKLIFAGTPEFARCALESLHAAGHDIALVLTQPDRPAGRGMKLQASAVKQFANEKNIPVAQPRSLRLDGKYPQEALAAQQLIAETQADAMIVAAYGLILPQWALDAPRLGCFNIHASLLPRWRGAAPIHRAIEAGDKATGVTIMQMDAGLDTGDALLMESLVIAPDETTPGLHDKLAALGARMLLQTLEIAATGSLTRTPQASEGITYAHKIDKAESAVNWSNTASQIERKIRAFNPFPGCTAQLRGETIKLCAAHLLENEESPNHSENDSSSRMIYGDFGQITSIKSDGIAVQCGSGQLVLTELQRAGGKRMKASDFLRGFALQVGEKFE